MAYVGGLRNFPWLVTSKKVGEMECRERERNVANFLGCYKPRGIFSVLRHKPWRILILPRFAFIQTTPNHANSGEVKIHFLFVKNLGVDIHWFKKFRNSSILKISSYFGWILWFEKCNLSQMSTKFAKKM